MTIADCAKCFCGEYLRRTTRPGCTSAALAALWIDFFLYIFNSFLVRIFSNESGAVGRRFFFLLFFSICVAKQMSCTMRVRILQNLNPNIECTRVKLPNGNVISLSMHFADTGNAIDSNLFMFELQHDYYCTLPSDKTSIDLRWFILTRSIKQQINIHFHHNVSYFGLCVFFLIGISDLPLLRHLVHFGIEFNFYLHGMKRSNDEPPSVSCLLNRSRATGL